ncbi:phage tail protein [Campylobacter sp. MIT 99-7217]|uniref:phage tail-collar fiber domain-containing protein n=1 Tax=Campylobacter sp. MIT 99-7217 TaxID=535091 RepID=UPI0011581563|nr:phage tail protein [Campylobacter sp. MIT 99-7217]TQR29151.1 phage tail protein [Campylobacter sp. MIT 99-7217]
MNESKFYTILTKVGIAKFIAARASGNGVNIASFKLSSDVLVPNEDISTLSNIVYEANINSKYIDDKNKHYVHVECLVPSNVGGFEINLIGIYDDEGALLAVGNLPTTYKPLLSEGSAKELLIKITMELKNASEVLLKIDPSVIMASRDYVNEIKLELKLDMSNLENELKILIDTKEDKGVASSLDTKLKAELIALINQKENANTAQKLVNALRTELTSKINSSVPKLTVASTGGYGSGYSRHTFYLNGIYQTYINTYQPYISGNNGGSS